MGDQNQRINSFRVLLNEISNELTERELQSLIHIYGVPGGAREEINNNGLVFFRYLIRAGFISLEKIGNLRNLLRKIKRPDLVSLVDVYIRTKFQTNDVRSVCDDFSDTWDQVLENRNESTAMADNETITSLCKIDCAYLNCVCHRMPSCYTSLIVLLIVATITTAFIWFANVFEVSNTINANSNLKNAGVYIIILEILALLIVAGFRFRGKLSSCLPCRKPGYAMFNNPSVQVESSQMSSPTSNSEVRGVARVPRQYKISQGSESGVSTSSEQGISTTTFGTMNETMNEQQEV